MFSPSSSYGSNGGANHLTAESSQFNSPRGSMTSTGAASGIFSGNGDGNGVPQYAPNFLFGAQHASKRRNLALPMSRTGVGSPGILKSKDSALSPANKSVTWSPMLKESSPDSKKDDGRDLQQKQQGIANSLWNGPPLRSIRDDIGPPEKQSRLESPSNSQSTSFYNESSVHDFEPAGASMSAPSDKDFWVTVFGFPQDQISAVLELFSKHGNIVSQKAPRMGNWIHIRYSSTVHVKQALARNGKVYDGLMIGVVPCNDREIIGEDGVVISENSSVHVFNASTASTSNDFLLNGSRMIPSTSAANTSAANRSRFSQSSRAGMRPLNSNFVADASGNINSDGNGQKNDGSFLEKFWSYVYNP